MFSGVVLMNEKELMIKKIDQMSSRIHELWSDISIDDANKMQDSWKDSLCDEYVKKIKNLDRTIVELDDELDMLRSYWEKYRGAEEEQMMVHQPNTEVEDE
jgi:uncharacterized protein YukE